MQRLRGSPSIVVLLFYFVCLWRATLGLCPSRCHCDDENLRVLCDQADLIFVPITLNPEVREIRLTRNHIRDTISSFNIYRNLRYLDISHNQVTSPGDRNFQLQHRLEFLLLNHNRVSSLSNESFVGLTALRVLHLNDNLLKSVPNGVFLHLLSLETLDLSSNQLEGFDPGVFELLSNLKTLLLRDNKLTSVPSPSFRNLTSLLVLDLGLNSFQTIPGGAFAALKELEKLSLDGCGITKLLPRALLSLSSLQILYLQDNRLTALPNFGHVLRLEEVNISRNLLTELPGKSFAGLGFLKTVEVAGCRTLRRVLSDAFADNSNLERIVLARNPHLSDLEPGAFEGLPNLRHVSLRANGLVYVDPKLLPWDELETLDLRENPLRCDCGLSWLQLFLLRRNFSSELVEVRCAGDPVGPLLLDIPPEDLECGSQSSRRQLIIGIVVATSVALGLLATAAFRFRSRLAGILQVRWGHGRKVPQYQKTSGDEDILQVAQLSLKDSPVTEL